MYKKEVTYTNFRGEEKTKTLYFNLSRKDMLNIAAKYDHNEGGYQKFLKDVMASKDASKVMPIVEDIIVASYGVLTEDGEGFKHLKGEALEEFRDSAMFDEFYFWLFGDADTDNPGARLSAFFEGVSPVIPGADTAAMQILPPGA